VFFRLHDGNIEWQEENPSGSIRRTMIAIYTSRRARPDDKIKLGDTEELQRKLPCPAGSSEPYWDILEESSTGVFFWRR